MKKLLYLIFSIFITINPSYAEMLKGGITYTVESARVATFEGAKTEIPVSSIQKYMLDPDYKANRDFIKYEISPSDRTIELYKKGKLKLAYSVTYNSDKNTVLYYSKLGGTLLFIDKNNKKQNFKYPVKVYRYNTKGKLIAAGIHISENEGYLYDKNQKLIVHRLGDYGYSAKGKKTWKAQEVKF